MRIVELLFTQVATRLIESRNCRKVLVHNHVFQDNSQSALEHIVCTMFIQRVILGLLVCDVVQGRMSVSSATVSNADAVDKTAFYISGPSLVESLYLMLL